MKWKSYEVFHPIIKSSQPWIHLIVSHCISTLLRDYFQITEDESWQEGSRSLLRGLLAGLLLGLADLLFAANVEVVNQWAARDRGHLHRIRFSLRGVVGKVVGKVKSVSSIPTRYSGGGLCLMERQNECGGGVMGGR